MNWVKEAFKAEAVSSRMNRRMYWIAVVVLLVVEAIVEPQPTIRNALTTFGFWMIVYGLRLHDIGRSAWWASLNMLVVITLIVGAFYGAPNAVAAAFGKWRGAPETNAAFASALIVAAILLSVGFTIWLGVVSGEAGTNRFGVPIKGWRFLQPSPKGDEANAVQSQPQAAIGAQTQTAEVTNAKGTQATLNDIRDRSDARSLFAFHGVRNPWMRIPLQAGVAAGALGLALVAWIAAWQLINASGLAPWSRPLHGWVEDLKAKAGRPER